jgi:NhaP-type Na+/H+ or K+/H+ antiporter
MDEGQEGTAGSVLPLVISLVVAIWLSHVVHLRKLAYLTEATVALLVGVVAGGAAFLYYSWWRGERLPSSLVELNTEVFFDCLLPPIIFQCGFSVKKKAFFRNFMTLLLLGVVGTWMTAAMVATGTSYVLKWLDMRSDLVRSSLSLGAIFSASDSVAALQVLDQDRSPMLFSLLFGEGVVNDAVSIVLLRAVQGIRKSSQLNADTLSLIALNFGQLFVLSLLLGAAVGLFSAWFIKRTFVHHSTDREVAAVALLGFVAYQLAEGLHLSGIFSVFFCGIVMR